MPRRLVRLVFRIAGWLLTPLVLISAAAIGAFVGLVAAPKLPSANISFAVTGGLAFTGAVLGLIFWIRLLRVHPGLRHTLEMTVEGTPDTPLVQRLIHPDSAPSDTPQ